MQAMTPTTQPLGKADPLREEGSAVAIRSLNSSSSKAHLGSSSTFHIISLLASGDKHDFLLIHYMAPEINTMLYSFFAFHEIYLLGLLPPTLVPMVLVILRLWPLWLLIIRGER
jgi:hypothetical protein